MKQIIFIPTLLLASIATTAHSQENVLAEGKHRVYCELLGHGNLLGTKVKVSVDFGQKVTWNSDQHLVDSNGKKIKFNSMVDAMNYMGNFGWKFVQAYAITIGQSNVYHWLLYKDIVEESEKVEGFMTKEQFKALQSEE